MLVTGLFENWEWSGRQQVMLLISRLFDTIDQNSTNSQLTRLHNRQLYYDTSITIYYTKYSMGTQNHSLQIFTDFGPNTP